MSGHVGGTEYDRYYCLTQVCRKIGLQLNKMDIKVVMLDFDKTLTKEHVSCVPANAEALQAERAYHSGIPYTSTGNFTEIHLIDHLHDPEFLTAFCTALLSLKKPIQVHIASFGYPEFIRAHLHAIRCPVTSVITPSSLTNEAGQPLTDEAGQPLRDCSELTDRKLSMAAQLLSGDTVTPINCLLFDDDQKNTEALKHGGYRTCVVPTDGPKPGFTLHLVSEYLKQQSTEREVKTDTFNLEIDEFLYGQKEFYSHGWFPFIAKKEALLAQVLKDGGTGGGTFYSTKALSTGKYAQKSLGGSFGMCVGGFCPSATSPLLYVFAFVSASGDGGYARVDANFVLNALVSSKDVVSKLRSPVRTVSDEPEIVRGGAARAWGRRHYYT